MLALNDRSDIKATKIFCLDQDDFTPQENGEYSSRMKEIEKILSEHPDAYCVSILDLAGLLLDIHEKL